MKRIGFVILFLSLPIFVNAQKDSLVINRKNDVYLIPTAIPGNFFAINSAWVLVGYDRIVNAKNSLGFAVGAIVYSKPSNSSWGKTKGFNFNIQHKYILQTEKPYHGTTTQLYYATNFFYQFTKSTRFENSPSNEYVVNRNMFSITPEIGFLFFSKINLYTDIGMGVGLKDVTTKTIGKISPPTTSENFLLDEIREQGNVFGLRFFVQYKIGYRF